VVTHVRAKSTRPSRVGFVVSKAIGNAVRRNQVKRRMRHACGELLSELCEPTDIVVRALPRSGEATFTQLRSDIRRCLRKIGVMQ